MRDVVVVLLEQCADGDPASVSERELARRAGVGQATLWPLLDEQLWPCTHRLVRGAQAAGVSDRVLQPPGGPRPP